MKRLLCSVLLAGAGLTAQTPKSVQATLTALKDAGAPRKVLSDQLVTQMMGLAKSDFYRPSRTTVQRFSEDFTGALLGRDITTVRAKAFQTAIFGVLSGKGSTFMPAGILREALTSCGIEDRTVQMIVSRFIDIGREVRGPDDVRLQETLRLK